MNVTIRITTYQPRFQPQLNPADPNGGVNCSAYGLAMALDYATAGGLVVTGAQVRALSNEPRPDPNSPGLNLGQLAAVAKALRVPIMDNTGKVFSVLETHLRARRAVLLQGMQRDLGRYAPTTFEGGHLIVLTDIDPDDRSIWTWNPLDKGPRSIPFNVIKKYAEVFGAATGLGGGGCRFAVTRQVPLVATHTSI